MNKHQASRFALINKMITLGAECDREEWIREKKPGLYAKNMEQHVTNHCVSSKSSWTAALHKFNW